jgi:class 3 adenylate cyclase
VLNANASLKTFRREEYHCGICADAFEPTLDEMVEASFTVSPRVRRIAAHEPESLEFWEYMRQVYWSSGIHFPDDESFSRVANDISLDTVELAAGEKCQLSLQLPARYLLVFEPVTHIAQHLNVRGDAATQRQELTIVYTGEEHQYAPRKLAPGPLRLTLENRTGRKLYPGIYIGGPAFKTMIAQRRSYLTANRLLTNQTFREVYRAETLDVDQRLKLTSLSFLFTDLKGSTALYERVGDLAAFDLVRAHFGVLAEAVSEEHGAVVKTIGDAVMATFVSPDRAIAAALRMLDAMNTLNQARQNADLEIKIGIHEGPCLAVTLNERLDYFGQAVNIAARVQALAEAQSIFATEPVIRHPGVGPLLAARAMTPRPRQHALRGLNEPVTVYEIGG